MGSRYTNEQRKEIIKLHTKDGYSTRLLAKKYQIGRTTIQSWLRTYRNETGEAPEQQNRTVIKSSKEAVSKKKMLKEIEIQLSVLKSFQKELERWDVPK
ncbi:MAG: helix-turn-helix domain-containing protein [Desulfosporosinus sp.]|nr:helix-turn-helix domain-containing protein [Desulfosporosinus sp.]